MLNAGRKLLIRDGAKLKMPSRPSPPNGDIKKTSLNEGRTQESSVLSKSKDKATIREETIRDGLSRILQSSIFAQSERLGRFLRFTVETTLRGETQILKEYVIGTEVYDRKPPYHPSEDSIVRSEARRLRSKLQQYYESLGKDEPLFIYYRPGSYVPVFRLRCGQDADTKDTTSIDPPCGSPATRIAVLPFVDSCHGELSGACSQITDELIHELVRTEGVRVSAASSIAPLVAQALDLPSVAQRLDVNIVLEGTVRKDKDQLRIASRVVGPDGFLIWSEHFETEPGTESLFKVSERIASAVISRVRSQQSPSASSDRARS